MRFVLLALLLVAAMMARGDAATFPTCASINQAAGCAGSTLGQNFWDNSVNIRFFGAKGDGVTDDTAAIQAAIDFAYNHNLQTIFCPSGDYLTSSIIYLDPPGNLRSNFANPTIFDFSLAFEGQGQAFGYNGTAFGCRLHPNFNNTRAFVVGPGSHMKVSGIAVLGPNNAYHGNLNTGGVGIGIAGGNGGAHHVIVENTNVQNFYKLYETDTNGACCLADANFFKSVSGGNGKYGIYLGGTQSFINRAEEPNFNDVEIAISDTFSHQFLITGGSLSPESSQNNSFGISGTTGLTAANDGGITFTTTIASPDIYWPKVYNSFEIKTNDYGIVPATLDLWNAATSAAGLHITPEWVTSQYGRGNIAGNTDFAAEVAAATKIYASERIKVVQGEGVTLDGVHVEHAFSCGTLYDLTAVWQGTTRSTIRNLFYGSDPGHPNWIPSGNPSDPHLAIFYCQQTFPWIHQSNTANNGRLELDGGDYGQTVFFQVGIATSPPLLIQVNPGIVLSGRQMNNIAPLNMQVYAIDWSNYTEVSVSGQVDTIFYGAGDWDTNYFMPHGLVDNGVCSVGLPIICTMLQGHLTVPFHGYHPKYAPNLTPDIYRNISTTPSVGLGTYPPIDCETTYRSQAWSTTPNFLFRSASCPGWSWGKTLTDTPVGETVKWSYHGKSAVLMLTSSPRTLSWMFPGLGFKLLGGTGDGSGGADQYVVTGVFPALGYITASDATTADSSNLNQTSGGGPLPGNVGQIFHCESSCSIVQIPFNWTSTPQ